MSYAGSAEQAAWECARWLRDHPEAKRLPDVWKAPMDCPLWRAGLSAAQAQWAWTEALEILEREAHAIPKETER